MICLNNQNVGNLIAYLQKFPMDAKVVIHEYSDKFESYVTRDCVIGCNFENQVEKNTVLLMAGDIINFKA
jgi:hypothetical protein